MESMLFRNPRALSSAIATLGLQQPWAFGFLNSVDPLVSASNYYLEARAKPHKTQVQSTWVLGGFAHVGL